MLPTLAEIVDLGHPIASRFAAPFYSPVSQSTCFALTALLTLASPAMVFAQPKAFEKAVNSKGGGSSATNPASSSNEKKGNPDPGGPNSNSNSQGNSSANSGNSSDAGGASNK